MTRRRENPGSRRDAVNAFAPGPQAMHDLAKAYDGGQTGSVVDVEIIDEPLTAAERHRACHAGACC